MVGSIPVDGRPCCSSYTCSHLLAKVPGCVTATWESALGAVGHPSRQGLLDRRRDLLPEFEEPLLRRLRGLFIGRSPQRFGNLTDVHPGESPLLQHPSRRDDLLV